MKSELYFALFGLVAFFVGLFALTVWKFGLMVLGIVCFAMGCIAVAADKGVKL